MDKKKKKTGAASSVWSTALFISGASLGAGLLALPIQTGLAGLLPALAGLVFTWGLMLATGFVLADAYIDLKHPSAGFSRLFRQELGNWSDWLVIPSFLLIFYGIMVAYLSGSGSVLANLFQLRGLEWLFMLLFFLCSSAVVLVGMRIINRANAGFMLLLIFSFTGLVVVAGGHLQAENLQYRDWRFLPSTLPIIVTAFAFQNVIPSVCTSLDNNRSRIRKAMFFGTLLTLLVSGTWIVVVLGVLPVQGVSDSLLSAFHGNQPATVPLDNKIHSSAMGLFGLLFSMAALFTSYVAVGEGLRNFLADLVTRTPLDTKKTGKLTVLLTFIPPLAVTLVYPEIFLTMLDIVGGLGVIILFGLLPGMVLFRRARKQHRKTLLVIAALLCLFCTALIGLECAQETGLLRIDPRMEYQHGG